MKRRLLALLALLLCLSLSLTGCGRPKSGKAFAMPITDEPVSLDPQIAHSNAEKRIISNCFEGLLTVGPDGKLLPGVAETYTVSPDGLSYVFSLRKDTSWCVFSKHAALLKEPYGKNYKDDFPKAVTADDFVFALERVRDPQTDSPDAYLFSAIQSVTAPDTHTLKIVLSYPDENFLYALTAPGAMPCNRTFFALTGGRYGLETGYTLCNGPFHVASWLEKTSIKLSKNDAYKGERSVKPSSLTLYYNKDKTQIAGKMADEIYDAAFLTEQEWKAMPHQKKFSAQQVTDSTVAFLFNQRDALLANETMRRALTSALSPDDVHLPQGAIPAKGIVPPFCTVGNTPLRIGEQSAKGFISHQAAQAATDFEEAMLQLGKHSAEIEVLCTAEYETYVREVLQLWQKTLGVRFVGSVTVLPEDELEAAIRSGRYQIALGSVRAASAFAPDFLEQFGTENVLGFQDAHYVALLEKMHREKSNFDTLRELVETAETYLLEHAVLYPVEYENHYFVTKQDTAGIYFYASRDYVYFIDARKK